MPRGTNKRGKKAAVRASISLSKRDHSELERIAEKKKVSLAWVVREAVERYLNQEAPLLREGQDRE